MLGNCKQAIIDCLEVQRQQNEATTNCLKENGLYVELPIESDSMVFLELDELKQKQTDLRG